MKIKAHNIGIFYIFIYFITFLPKSSSEKCENIIISKDIYNLYSTINNYNQITTAKKNNYIIKVFSYLYLDDFEYMAKQNLIDYLLKISQAEKEKSHNFFSKFWNRGKEQEIELQRSNFRKLSKLFELLHEKIKRLEWLENNIILTAISIDKDCPNVEVKFVFEKEMRYKDNFIIIRKMAKRTCTLKKNECSDEKECIKNILTYIECLTQKRKGIRKHCPMFNEFDCSLDDNEKFYDL